MKTVGIVTLYKVRNLGACLQAIATKRVLNELNVQTVYVKSYGKEMAWELFKGDMGTFRPWYIPSLIMKDLKFRLFFKVFNEISIEDINGNVDGIVIGSDSIWVSSYGKLSLPAAFWGDIDCNNIRAYAPSVGGAYDMSQYASYNIECLKKIKAITVRDEYTRDFVNKSIGYNADIVLDPTLLVDWGDIAKQYKPRIKRDYIVIYGPLSIDDLNEVKKFATKTGCQLINIGSFNRRIKYNRIVNPYEFVGYIGAAKYVFTSMFHGVMLCLSLNKNFKYIPTMKNRSEKLKSTFDVLNIDTKVVYFGKTDDNGQFIWGGYLDYNLINLRLCEERNKSRKLFREWFCED